MKSPYRSAAGAFHDWQKRKEAEEDERCRIDTQQTAVTEAVATQSQPESKIAPSPSLEKAASFVQLELKL